MTSSQRSGPVSPDDADLTRAATVIGVDGSPAAGETLCVVLAARDVERFLPETLRSLDAQTMRRFRLVAVDDGSVDGTGDLLAAHAAAQSARRPVVILRTGGIGLAAARNVALEACDDAFVAILDGDDLLAPDLLARACRILADDPGADLVFPLCDHVDEQGRRLGVRSPVPPHGLTPAQSLIRPPIHTDSGVVVRRAALEAAGRFDARLTGCVGLDAWYRVLSLRSANARCLREPLVLYRRRAGQITGSAARMERNFTAFLDARATGDASVPSAVRRRAMANHRLYWASVAYANGDVAAARAHTVDAWRTDPGAMIRTPYAYARAVVSASSLLPDRVHGWLRNFALWTRSRIR